MKFQGLSILLLAVLFIGFVDGTHFRGGSLSWEPVGVNGSQIEIRYRFGWRLNFEPHDSCTEEAIKNGTLIDGVGELMVVKRGEDGDTLFEEIVKEPLDYVCTDRAKQRYVGRWEQNNGRGSLLWFRPSDDVIS